MLAEENSAPVHGDQGILGEEVEKVESEGAGKMPTRKRGRKKKSDAGKSKRRELILDKECDYLLQAPTVGEYDYDIRKAGEYTTSTMLEQEVETERIEAERSTAIQLEMVKTVEEYNQSVDSGKSI